MEKLSFVKGAKFCVIAFRSKSGAEMRALAVDLGYTSKFLTFDTQTIAELFGLAVICLVQATPIIEGQKTKYFLE